MDEVSLNGKLIPRREAVISIDDRGFRFGDGAFETIRVFAGIPYLWEAHLARLVQGLAVLSIPCDPSALRDRARVLIGRHGASDCLLRIVVTRGCGSRGYLPAPGAEGPCPTVLIELAPLPPSPPPERLRLCLSAWEKPSPKSLPAAKLTQAVNSILAAMQAEALGCVDAVLRDARGHIAECGAANIFWLKRRRLHTPSLATGCLPGVTRQRLMEIGGYQVREGLYSLRHLLRADAVAIVNSAHPVLPAHGMEGYATRWRASEKLAHILRLALDQDMAVYADKRPETISLS